MALNEEKFKYLDIQNVNLLPSATGVYCFCKGKTFLYIGKAINIKERVKNHISQPVFKDNIFVPQAEKIGFIATSSEIEALILEANLIKKFQPKYNTVWRDGKSHNYVFITKEKFPRIFVSHQLPATNYQLLTNRIGPFIDGNALKQTLRILRKVFPYRTCAKMPKKPCLYKELGLCFAPCQFKVQSAKFKVAVQNSKLEREYKRNIKNLTEILRGKKNSVVKNLRKGMKQASQKQDFEKAKIIRDQIFALENVFSHSHVFQKEVQKYNPQGVVNLQKVLNLNKKIKRIEGYDISNIQGLQATGGLVVFENNKPNKNEYRKFKIKISGKPNDTAMLKEIISRRLKHKEWPLPQVMLIDGGIGQLNAAIERFKIHDSPKESKLPTGQARYKNKTKIIALAKRKNELFIEGKDKPVLLKDLPPETANLILRVRDEAHRFAISYHKTLRSKNFI